MIYPASTAFYGAVLALLYVGLSAWVMAGRVSADVLHGDGGNAGLEKRIRAQGNFGEYVPLALLLIGLLEAGGGGPTLVRSLLIGLVIARVLHPFGMFAPKNAPSQFVCRGGGILATFAVIAVAAVALLLRVG
ncbi:glutathione S-transferase [Methylobacterium sp. Leaf104]|uniref:MAPEG family protein n=1 Tax=Methylobacterium TaxID=407 RepID=UPI0006F4F018|nr:MAPEG family protein [Methylobacterium sp. Leaf104]KQP29876.1 glutathione S-transferase [Methylobacterium sp. Leaf104]MCI9882435.1 MAPEG family protein [Methylobacterium goesingense]